MNAEAEEKAARRHEETDHRGDDGDAEGDHSAAPPGASRPVAGAAMRRLCLGLDLDATVPDGLAERLPVALVLVRVGHREVREGLIERLRLPEIARDQPGCAGARVRAGERPPTGFRVLPHGPWREELGERLELHVAELAHVEVTTLGPDGPAQEEIAGRLHE